MRAVSCAFSLLFTFLLLACSGGGSSSTPPPTVQPPAALTYSTNPAVYTQNVTIAANTPSSTGGAVVSYAVSPALPAGLSLNPSTGVITGRPTAIVAAAVYTVAATNSAGTTTVGLNIRVNAAPENPWQDLGTLPVSVTGVEALVAGENAFYAGTNQGVWRRPLNGGSWVSVGLDTLDVRTLRIVSANGHEQLLVGGRPIGSGARSFYRSVDDGSTWIPVESGLISSFSGDWLPMKDLAVKPNPNGLPVFYATMSGTSAARSTDLGQTWSFVWGRNEEYMTYDGYLHIPNGNLNTLYFGYEAPMDCAWVKRHDILDSGELGPETVIVDLPDISNRRINCLTSFPFQPGVVYAGLEGALIRINPDNSWKWIWSASSGGDPSPATSGDFPYAYIRFVWVDPENPDHMIFGGNPQVGLAIILETRDGGGSFHHLPSALGIDFSELNGFHAASTDGASGKGLLFALSLSKGSPIRIVRCAAL